MKVMVFIFIIASMLAMRSYKLINKTNEDDAEGTFPVIACAFFAIVAAIDFVVMLAHLLIRSL